ncbi:hypothetical protein pb186bvf_003592 [Paramecium bursaria]
MISKQELEIDEFLTDPQGTLENIQKVFLKRFNPEFQALQYMYTALLDDVLTRGQRIAAIYLISQSELRQILQDIYYYTTDQFEKKFIFNPDQYSGQAVRTVLDEAEKFSETFSRDFGQLKPTNIIRSTIQRTKMDASTNGVFTADFLRPIPIYYKQDCDFLDFSQIIDVQWNYNVQVSNDRLSQVKEIMQKAYQSQINDQEEKLLQDYFDNDQSLVKNSGLSPKVFPNLVEKNPQLAVFMVVKICQTPEFYEYLNKFLEIDLSKNVLDVYSNLISKVNISTDFTGLFVQQCIQQCQRQIRLVRFVCVFIKQLLKNKLLFLKDVKTELYAFAIENTRLQEATSLWKQLKQIEQQPQ